METVNFHGTCPVTWSHIGNYSETCINIYQAAIYLNPMRAAQNVSNLKDKIFSGILRLNVLQINSNFNPLQSWWSLWRYVVTGSGSGLLPTRQEAITWVNDDQYAIPYIVTRPHYVNSLRPGDPIWWQRINIGSGNGLSLPEPILNYHQQGSVHSPERKLTGRAKEFNL